MLLKKKSHPSFFVGMGGGGAVDPESVYMYDLYFILKNCYVIKYYCNITLFATAFIYIQI